MKHTYIVAMFLLAGCGPAKGAGDPSGSATASAAPAASTAPANTHSQEPTPATHDIEVPPAP